MKLPNFHPKKMNMSRLLKSSLQTYGLIVALVVGVSSPMWADYAPNISAAPYQLEKSILGIDGWQKRLATSPDNFDSARVIPLRWANGQPAIALRGANLKNTTFPPATGEKVRISFQLAVAFADRSGLREFRMFFGGAPIGEIYFDFRDGLGYGGHGTVTGGTVFLPKAEVAHNSFYNYELLLDFKTQTYNIAVKGKKKDGEPLDYSAKNIAFEKKSDKALVNSISILTSSRMPSYLRELKITAG
jgi:hypothetical protein